MRPHLIPVLVSLTTVAVLSISPACAAPSEQIKGDFSRFVTAQNSHDLKAVDKSLLVSPDFLWIAPGQTVRGRDAALERFGELFQRTWRVDPDWSTLQVMMLDVSTAEVFVRAKVTDGASTRNMRINHLLVQTPRAWRVMSIVFADAPTD
jgi:hypothetical protein